MKQGPAFALLSAPALAAAGLHLRSMQLIEGWHVAGTWAPLAERITVALDNWVVRLWPFATIFGLALSPFVAMIWSHSLAATHSRARLVGDARAWAAVFLSLSLGIVVLDGLGGSTYPWLYSVDLAVSWVGFMAWAMSCVSVLAVLRQTNPDFGLSGRVLMNALCYFALGPIAALAMVALAPRLAGWRARAV